MVVRVDCPLDCELVHLVSSFFDPIYVEPQKPVAATFQMSLGNGATLEIGGSEKLIKLLREETFSQRGYIHLTWPKST